MLAGASALGAQPLPPMDGPVYYGSRAYYGGRIAPPYVYAPEYEAMPSYEVAAIMRSRGFLPLGGPVRRGGFYVMAAVHPGGERRPRGDRCLYRPHRAVHAGAAKRPRPRAATRWCWSIRGRHSRRRIGMRAASALAAAAPPVSAASAGRPPRAAPAGRCRAWRAARHPTHRSVTPKPRPQAAPQRPDSAQAPPVPAPVETKPAAPSPPLAQKPVEKTPTSRRCSRPSRCRPCRRWNDASPDKKRPGDWPGRNCSLASQA